MSSTLVIKGIRPIDDEWHKMKKVYDACIEAEICIPMSVINFFDCGEPDEVGVEVDIDEAIITDQDNDYCEYIDISKLPKHVTKIKCYLC